MSKDFTKSFTKSFTMAIVSSNEDSILILQPFCKTCASVKLRVIHYLSDVISEKEAKEWIKEYGLRPIRVQCDPSNHIKN
jgi:hypothetical protein